MLYKVVLTFKSVNETLVCDHSNESYSVALLCRNVYYAVPALVLTFLKLVNKNPGCFGHIKGNLSERYFSSCHVCVMHNEIQPFYVVLNLALRKVNGSKFRLQAWHQSKRFRHKGVGNQLSLLSNPDPDIIKWSRVIAFRDIYFKW